MSGALQLDQVDAAILLTVVYRDLFDYPVTLAELAEYLIAVRADESRVAVGVERLASKWLSREGGYITLRGREHLAVLRQHRERTSRELWRLARRYAHWLSLTPYLRTVAVSGSLAVNNAEAGADLDFFCITEVGRLWVARLWMTPLVRLSRRVGRAPLEVNTIYSEAALEAEEKSCYIAHQIAQLVPVWGGETFRRFIAANGWINGYLPQNRVGERTPLMNVRRHAPVRWCERAGRHRLGDRLNAGLRQGYSRWATLSLRDPSLTCTVEQANRTRRPERFSVAVGHGHEIRTRLMDACDRWLRPHLSAELWDCHFAAVLGLPRWSERFSPSLCRPHQPLITTRP